MVCVHMCALSVAWLCPTLCDPMDCSPPGCSVHGILQTRIIEPGLPFLPPGAPPHLGIEPMSPLLASGFFTTKPAGVCLYKNNLCGLWPWALLLFSPEPNSDTSFGFDSRDSQMSRCTRLPSSLVRSACSCIPLLEIPVWYPGSGVGHLMSSKATSPSRWFWCRWSQTSQTFWEMMLYSRRLHPWFKNINARQYQYYKSKYLVVIVVWVCELTAVLEKSETLFWMNNLLFFALGSWSYGAPEIRRPKAIKWLKSNYINEVKRCHHIIWKWENFLQLSLGWSDWSVQNRYFGSHERNTVKEMDSHLLEHQDYDEEPYIQIILGVDGIISNFTGEETGVWRAESTS